MPCPLFLRPERPLLSYVRPRGYIQQWVRIGLDPRCFVHISITTPIVSALKNYYIQSLLEVLTDVLNHFWIQMAVSEVKRPLHGRFGSETENLTAIYLTGISQRKIVRSGVTVM